MAEAALVTYAVGAAALGRIAPAAALFLVLLAGSLGAVVLGIVLILRLGRWRASLVAAAASMGLALSTVVRAGRTPTTRPPLRRLPPIPSDVEACDAETALRIALGALGRDRLALSASFGPEDVVILDLLCRIEARPRVFTLDTGRLPDETYELIERLRRRFDVEVEVYFPDALAVEAMVRSKGVNLFYASLEDRLRCCDVRKIAPLRRALATLDGWITGLRREQAPTRARTPKISLDVENGLIWKVAPLADWTEAQVWEHIRANDLPYHALCDRGYRSVGCAPCTRAVAPGEDPRSGRWWWEAPGSRECGLHVQHAALRQVASDEG